MSGLLNVSFLNSFYFWMGISMTVFFILKLIIFSVSGMDDGSGDLIGTDVDDGFNFISLQSIIAFFMGFGWLGYAAIGWDFSGKISVAFAFVGGLIMFFVSVFLMSIMKKLNSTPKYDLNTCLDKSATSYTRFQAKGSGKIQIEFNGKLEIFDAVNDTDKDIESFKQVKVVRVEENKLFVVEV